MPSRDTKTEEKRGITAHTRLSGARLTSTKLSRPHLPRARAIYPHAPARLDIFDVITQQILSMQSGFKQPRLPLNITLLPWQRSASPLLGKPKGFLRDHSSKLRSSDPHRGGTRSRVDARGRPKARWWSEFFPQNCARKRTCRWCRGVHSELWMTPSPFYKRAAVLNLWCFRNILRVTVMQPHTHYTRSSAKLLVL